MNQKKFDRNFLSWFKTETEKKWSNYKERDPKELQSVKVSNCDFQKGSKWVAGMTDNEISRIEFDWGITFPPDYRLFLQILHTINQPMICPGFDGKYRYIPSFYNWQTEQDSIKQALQTIIEGLLFDVEHNNVWLHSWGEKPESQKVTQEKIHELVVKAPKLIPVFGHQYLLAEPCVAGNPVLSIVQSDIIVYSTCLRNYLIDEFLTSSYEGEILTDTREFDDYKRIPFWGELL